jgi:glycosyltransferase involved in cell wall biosynthesis
MAKLSVCIPTYNRADMLADRLKRMAAMQDKIELEISISDNASADHTQDVVEQFRTSFARFHYVRQPEVISINLNFYAPVRSATFDYITLIGDDDTIMPDSMAHALAMFEHDTRLQAVIGNNELYDFSAEESRGITRFIHKPERYTLANAHTMFEKHYFFEYFVMRTANLHRYFHNESYSYPTGWKAIHGCLKEGAVALEPLPLIYKGHSSDQLGYSNYLIEMQELPRTDPEMFAALMRKDVPDNVYKKLRHSALMRSVRYSADSSVSANMRKEYLLAMHHLQKGAMYDYDTQFYPRIAPDTLLFGRLAQWIVPLVKACPGIRITLENHPACHRLALDLQPLLAPGSIISFLPVEKLSMNNGTCFCISVEFNETLAEEAMQFTGTPYVALADMVQACCDKPADVPAMQKLLHQQVTLPQLQTA